MYSGLLSIRASGRGFQRSAIVTAVWAVTVAAWLSACGYQMTGLGSLPGKAQTIGVKMFVNRSIETGAEAVLANALSEELNRRRPGTVERVRHADAVMTGTIISINRDTISRSGTLTAIKRRLTLEVSMVLRDRSGKTLWERPRMTATGDYDVVEECNITTENNRRDALLSAADRLAEDAYRALTDDF